MTADAWARVADWTAPTIGLLRSRRATSAERAEDAPAARAERAALRAALRGTADEIRTSAAARRSLVSLIRPHLPAVRRDPGTAAASAFLARFDRSREVRRSTLSREYAEAGSPGALAPGALRALADDRWGPAVKRRGGHYTYRPTAARPGR